MPDLDEDGPELVAALARHGIRGVPAVWDSPEVDWSRFDLVVVRSTWDYAERRDGFLAWAGALPGVLNRHSVLSWNTHKRYLRELADAGVPVVATQFVEPEDDFSPPGSRFVVKPAISAGSRHSATYEPDEATKARDHVRALQRARRTVMIQPYLAGIDEHGETALMFIGGGYSHAVRKDALLQPGQSPASVLYLEETIEPRQPTPAERALAEQVMDVLPFPRRELLYGRVDLVPDDDGSPLVLEIELTEPSLFLSVADRAADRLAEEIALRLA